MPAMAAKHRRNATQKRFRILGTSTKKLDSSTSCGSRMSEYGRMVSVKVETHFLCRAPCNVVREQMCEKGCRQMDTKTTEEEEAACGYPSDTVVRCR